MGRYTGILSRHIPPLASFPTLEEPGSAKKKKYSIASLVTKSRRCASFPQPVFHLNSNSTSFFAYLRFPAAPSLPSAMHTFDHRKALDRRHRSERSTSCYKELTACPCPLSPAGGHKPHTEVALPYAHRMCLRTVTNRGATHLNCPLLAAAITAQPETLLETMAYANWLPESRGHRSATTSSWSWRKSTSTLRRRCDLLRSM